MSEWITDRPPSESDADRTGCVWCQPAPDVEVCVTPWDAFSFETSVAWMPRELPEPYQPPKPKRFKVGDLVRIRDYSANMNIDQGGELCPYGGGNVNWPKERNNAVVLAVGRFPTPQRRHHGCNDVLLQRKFDGKLFYINSEYLISLGTAFEYQPEGNDPDPDEAIDLKRRCEEVAGALERACENAYEGNALSVNFPSICVREMVAKLRLSGSGEG